MNTPITHLAEVGACSEARQWVADGKFKSLEAAWKKCDNPRWLLWYAGRKSGAPKSEGRKKLVLCACKCARLALPYCIEQN